MEKLPLEGEHAAIGVLKARSCLPAYLTLGIAWWGLAMFVLSVRIGSELWRPVFDVFFVQALIFDAIIPLSWMVAGRAIWLVVSCVLMSMAWFVVERGRKRKHPGCWQRALVSLIAVQAVLVVLGYAVGE